MAIETKSDRLPTRASLDALFSEARRVRVTAFPDVDVYDIDVEKLAEVRFDTLDLEGEDVLALRELLRIQDPEQPFFCGCEGDIRIELHGEAGLVAVLSAHHGESIDLAVPEGVWRSHAVLLDGPALLRWLDGRGVSGPLKRFENSERGREASERAHKAWAEAAPPGIDAASFPPNGLFLAESEFIDRVLDAFAAACPSLDDRVLALLRWFSVSSSTWWVSPAHEGSAGQLLARLGGVPVVLRALERGPVTEEALVGAARFLESVLQPDREDELTDVPDELWSRLIEATSRLRVEDNTIAIERAAAVAHAKRRI